MPPRHQRRTCLDWGCSRHAKLPQVPQISAGLALPTEELLSPHQPHWNCQRVRLSNDSIEQNPFDTLPCKSGNKASLASPTGWILALTARRGANGTFRQDRGFGTLLGSITSWQSTPSMRRPVRVKPFLSFFLSSSGVLLFPNCSHRAKLPLSPPFHPHSLLSDCRSVQVGCT
jgi:hypothetical protein